MLGNQAWSLEIVYPKTSPVRISAQSTFFIGATNPSDTLTINDIQVELSRTGAFAQIVPLSYGINNFIIKTCTDEIKFVIERPFPTKTFKASVNLIEYPIMGNFFVVKDGTPLRSTPIDGGINRLSHLPKGMRLFVNGEKGDFYRVYLNSKFSGWIAKTDVEQKECEKNAVTSVTLSNFDVKNERDFYLYEFDLDNQTPFVLTEDCGLTLKLFNVAGQPDSTYLMNIPMLKLSGYEAYYKNNKFVVKVRKSNPVNPCEPLKDIVIAVDPGHGGDEFGAIGAFGDKEKDINLAISKNLKNELKRRGAIVFMTRENDKNVSLQDRVNFAKEKDAQLLISVHANALADGADPLKNKGTSVYYYHNQAKPLAEAILSSMTSELGINDDRVRQGSLALVRPTSCVSVLIEVGYIINPDDYALLLDKTFQQNCAKAIADGIEKYLVN